MEKKKKYVHSSAIPFFIGFGGICGFIACELSSFHKLANLCLCVFVLSLFFSMLFRYHLRVFFAFCAGIMFSFWRFSFTEQSAQILSSATGGEELIELIITNDPQLKNNS